MKKKPSKFKRNKYMILFLVVFLGYVGYTVFNTEIRIHELKAKEAALQDELKKVTLEKEQLIKDLEDSRNLESIERIAREKLKMVKPNEIIYVIKEQPKATDNKDSQSTGQGNTQGAASGGKK